MVRASTRVRSGSHEGGGARTDDGYDPKRNKAPQDGGGLLNRLIAWVAGHHIPLAQLLQGVVRGDMAGLARGQGGPSGAPLPAHELHVAPRRGCSGEGRVQGLGLTLPTWDPGQKNGL